MRQPGVSKQSKQIQAVAKQLASAQIELEKLPIRHQYDAVSLADDLRKISSSVAKAGALGAATARLLAGGAAVPARVTELMLD